MIFLKIVKIQSQICIFWYSGYNLLYLKNNQITHETQRVQRKYRLMIWK